MLLNFVFFLGGGHNGRRQRQGDREMSGIWRHSVKTTRNNKFKTKEDIMVDVYTLIKETVCQEDIIVDV